MAEQQSAGVDPVSGFWRDVWARMAAAQGAATPSSDGGVGAMPFMTPESLRKMQASFFQAMAQYAEQYMRSPEFLAAMKRSMDQALQFRQQMDDFLKSNMASTFETATGGTNSEILGAIRQMSNQVQSQISRLEERVAGLEAAAGTAAAESAPQAKARASKPSRKSRK